MGLAVDSQHGTVRVDHGNAVVEHVAVLLVEAYRHCDIKLRRDSAEVLHRRILLHGHGKPVAVVAAFLAEIPVLEKLRQEYYVRALCGGFPDKLLCLPDGFFRRVRNGHLYC